MTDATEHPLSAFHWQPQPGANRLVERFFEQWLVGCPSARGLAHRLESQSATRLIDWLDHLVIVPGTAGTAALETELAMAGFVADPQGVPQSWGHPLGRFPRLVVGSGNAIPSGAIRCDRIDDAVAALGGVGGIEGGPGSPYRRALVARDPGGELWVEERHGYRGPLLPEINAYQSLAALSHQEAFHLRRRRHADEDRGFDTAQELIVQAQADLGVPWTAALFFAAERSYWQQRNHAAGIQKQRQDRFGLGWANHDHHTYRSSRRHFTRLIACLEQLGLSCRERFYAGQAAGWGAQVLEDEVTGVVVFADVDLAPDELLIDFAHQGLPPRSTLGTVGLWCALHGEAFLEAGMHHLECTFDFNRLRDQLVPHGISLMKPFSDLPYLHQAFTEGETWAVEGSRIDALVAAGMIDQDQAKRFREHGAIGSHLENLQRGDGFKGFNQHGVDEIISGTDPRRHLVG